jgi:hypothetical protein
MKNKIATHEFGGNVNNEQVLSYLENAIHSGIPYKNNIPEPHTDKTNDLAEILFITSYPPRVCGIATYSRDLIKVLNNK